MNRRFIAASLTVLATAAAGAVMTLNGSSATGAPSDLDVWKGQSVDSWAQGRRITHASAPNTLSLTSVNRTFDLVDVGAPDTSVGDYFLLRLRLLDEAGETHVGTGTVRCELGSGTQACHATLLVYGRGQITVDGVFYQTREQVSFAILGGTGGFRGVGGTMRVVDTQNESHLVLHLIR